MQNEEEQHQIKHLYQSLDATVMHIFASHGWRFSNQLCF
jgi:hypothetical protein